MKPLLWLLLLAIGCATVPLPGALCAKQQPGYSKQELRGVWIASVDSVALDSPANIEAALDEADRLQLNTVFPTVWNKGAIFFDAPDLISDPAFTPPALRDRDVLAEVIAAAKRHGLRVVPWFEYGLKLPARSLLVRRHPEWFLRDAKGGLGPAEGPLPAAYLNPLHPDAAAFLLQLFLGALDRYPVDAIQLDDHFSIPASLGYDGFTARKYRDDHAGQAPPQDERDPEWVRWRAAQLTGFVERLAAEVHARHKKLSVSPNTWPFAYQTSLQDWPAWAAKGYLDEVVIQLYRRDVHAVGAELDKPYIEETRACVPLSIGLLAGVVGKPANPPEAIDLQIESVWRHRLDGVAFFHDAFLTQSLAADWLRVVSRPAR